MLTQQPNNMHLSQPGLLPLPVQPQYSTVPMRPLVMTSEQSVVRIFFVAYLLKCLFEVFRHFTSVILFVIYLFI